MASGDAAPDAVTVAAGAVIILKWQVCYLQYQGPRLGET